MHIHTICIKVVNKEKGGRTLQIISKGERTGENDRNNSSPPLCWFGRFCYQLKYGLIYVVKAWEKRGDKTEDNHLNLLHNSPPVVAPIVSARFSNIFILSCLVTILSRSILILNCRLSLCKKLSNDCQKVTKTTIRNIPLSFNQLSLSKSCFQATGIQVTTK